jgi:hypothetical protein
VIKTLRNPIFELVAVFVMAGLATWLLNDLDANASVAVAVVAILAVVGSVAAARLANGD